VQYQDVCEVFLYVPLNRLGLQPPSETYYNFMAKLGGNLVKCGFIGIMVRMLEYNLQVPSSIFHSANIIFIYNI
jgi:hypothetical protein